MVKESACQEGDVGLIPELGRSPGEGNGNPIQFLNPMDRGTWWANSTGLQRVRDNLVTKPPPPPEAKRDFSLVFTLGAFEFLKINPPLEFNSQSCPHWASAAKSLQLCPTLCDSIDVSPPGSPAAGILQARTLEWVAISFSNA